MTGTKADDWLNGFEQGRAAGARFRGQFGPVDEDAATSRDALVRALSSALVQDALGNRPGRDELVELRRLAVTNRSGDWDGVSLGAVAVLARQFGDAGSLSWLATMLAGAGRYEEAAGVDFELAVGRPPAAGLVILTSALALLNRPDDARERLEWLRDSFPALRDEFVSVWDDTTLGREFARLLDSRRRDVLPVFYHLPFSGGTSMIVSLKSTVPWAATIEIQRRHGLYQIENALRLDAQEVASKLLVHQHHPYPLSLSGRELSYFTVLRDPVSQLRSGFYKRRSASGIVPTRDKDSATFEAHAEYTMAHGMTNMLARQLVVTHPDFLPRYEARFQARGRYRSIAAEEDMYWLEVTADLSARRLLALCRETLEERFHVVGTMKHLAASHLAAAGSVGLPVAQRIVHRGKSGQPDSGLPAELEKRLRKANSVDQKLYDLYTERFESEHHGLIDVVEAQEAVVA